MAKRTAIIDIGSNSARLVIFEKTSRYGFHLICEQKSKVRIGEGAYEKGGYLQPIGIKRAFFTLLSFYILSKNTKSTKQSVLLLLPLEMLLTVNFLYNGYKKNWDYLLK